MRCNEMAQALSSPPDQETEVCIKSNRLSRKNVALLRCMVTKGDTVTYIVGIVTRVSPRIDYKFIFTISRRL